MLRRWRSLSLILALYLPQAVYAQSPDWDNLHAEVLKQEKAKNAEARMRAAKALLAVSEKEEPQNAEHMDVALDSVAQAWQAQYLVALATPYLERRVQLEEQAMPGNAGRLMIANRSLVSNYQQLRRYDDALPLLERNLALRESMSKGGDPFLALDIGALGTNYRLMKKYDQAEALYRRAEALPNQIPGANPVTVELSVEYGLLLAATNRDKQAAQHFESALKVANAAAGPRNRYTSRAGRELAAIYIRQGRLAAADSLLSAALEFEESSGVAGSPARNAILDSLARLYLAKHDESRAADFERRAADGYEANARHWEELAAIYRKNDAESAALIVERFAAASRRHEQY